MVEFLFLLLDQIISYGATKLKNMVKFYVPTWPIFTVPVMYSWLASYCFITVILDWVC